MKQAETPDKARTMGRRPMHMKPVPVRLAPEALERIEKIAGKYGRPGFIRQAVEEKLAREESPTPQQ